MAKLLRHEFGIMRIAFPLFDRWVARQIRRTESFDMIIGYENSNLITFQTAKQLGKVTILDLAQVHHNLIDSIGTNFRINGLTREQTEYINQRKQAALDATDYILTLSSFATQSLTENGICRSRIHEVNLGIDVQKFTPVEKPLGGPFRVLFVGEVCYRKGIDLVLKVFRQLALPDAELILIGPVSDGKDLLMQCTGAVRHLPFLHHDELVRYYQQADVFVFPSYLDSWGQVVLEAMACGTPVIVSENTGSKDAVLKGGGFVIPAGDESAMATKILHFYTNRSEVNRLGAVARRVAEQYTWENYYQQVTTALEDIARKENISTE
ncbi:glycosyltransferase family 4 protein [Spirosoma sp. SC4-14]|uniref:glycosyltransferase family 4 protein n=1 Tax=Spirosoma sp. SC4-14 TaxID=3128900 RepID=UPI0030CBDF81